MKKVILFVLLTLLISFSTEAQISSVKQKTANPNQYSRTDFNVILTSTFSNPFWSAEIALDMLITSPSGKKLVLPCFYVSGKSGKESNWQARFTPVETGSYSYQFALKKDGKVVNSSAAGTFSVSSSKGKGFLRLKSDWAFQYDNGEIFRGIGENICWESRKTDDNKYFSALHEEPRYNYDYMLPLLAKNGGNFFRTWMCSWNLPLEYKKISENTNRYQDTDEYFNPGGIKRMDHLVNLMDSLGIHVMLAIDAHGNYLGDTWEQSNYNVKNGGFAKTPAEFFSHPKAKEQYKNRLRYLIARWGYSPSIGAWEFFNEVDNLMYAGKPEDKISDESVTAWHQEMSDYFEANDPYQHLVTTSISHRDVAGMNSIKSMDFNQKHIYKNTTIIPQVIKEYTKNHGKPYVIGEFGYEWDWNKNFNTIAEELDSDYKRGLWYGLFSPTPILPMSWWWEFFENRGLMPYFSRVRTIHDQMLAAGKGNYESILVESSVKDIQVYGVKTGNKTFVYLYNPGKSEVKTDLSVSSNVKKGQVFDCETGGVSEFTGLKGFTLAAGKDKVLILE
ncbi:MAG: DUF5060 domain-containing protein [Bacteroidetes bacterium]|nr:DUF5060 domain-containing protein [Bacteroidota bacterium]